MLTFGVMRSRVAWCVLLCALLVQTGCYDWVAVNPLDAPKLGGSFETQVGPNTIAVRVVDVRQPDGRLVELTGSYGVRVTLKNGQVHKLKPPIGVEENGDRLVFRSGSEGPLDVSRDDIAKLEAYHHDKQGTTAVIVVVSVIAVAAVVAATVAAVSVANSASNTSYSN